MIKYTSIQYILSLFALITPMAHFFRTCKLPFLTTILLLEKIKIANTSFMVLQVKKINIYIFLLSEFYFYHSIVHCTIVRPPATCIDAYTRVLDRELIFRLIGLNLTM